MTKDAMKLTEEEEKFLKMLDNAHFAKQALDHPDVRAALQKHCMQNEVIGEWRGAWMPNGIEVLTPAA